MGCIKNLPIFCTIRFRTKEITMPQILVPEFTHEMTKDSLYHLDPNKTVKFVNNQPKDLATFNFMGLPSDGQFPNRIFLTSFVNDGHYIKIETCYNSTNRTKITNFGRQTPISIFHHNVPESENTLGYCGNMIITARPFSIVFFIFDPADQKEKLITMNLQSIPADHGVIVCYTIEDVIEIVEGENPDDDENLIKIDGIN